MNSERRYFVWQNKAVLILALVIGALSLVMGGCGKKEEPPPAPALVDGVSSPAITPELSSAIAAGNTAAARKIIDAGANIDAKDAQGRTPLHMAALRGNTKIAGLLMERGAKVDARDHAGMTPLHAAAISGGRETVRLLLDKQADIRAQNAEGQSALHLSAGTGQPRLTKFLIERGADPLQKDAGGNIPLYYAQKNRHPQTAAVLERAVRQTSAPPETAAVSK